MKLYHFIFILTIICIKSEFTKLVLEENFSGNSLNTSLWEFDIGNDDGWGNDELQYYRKNSENIFIQNNQLHIVARVKEFGEKSYTSARILTKKTFQFTYGKVEARIKLPVGQGIWPAFWMLGANIDEKPWPNCGEIDILEAINAENVIYNTLHFANETGDHKMSDFSTKIENVNEFHIYTLTWTKDQVKMFIDNKESCSVNLNELPSTATDAFRKPFYLLLNVAVGGNWPKTVDDSVLPLEMIVDYIKIYQEEENYKYTPKYLIWEDHFDSNTLNTSIWKYTTGNGGWGTGQLQYYTDSKNNVYLSNSNLNLKAIKESYEGSSYTSGRISTEGKLEFTYGVIETRMKFPLVDGLSGRLMLYGTFKNGEWPVCGEIDALVGKDSFNTLTSGIYWDNSDPYFTSNNINDYNISQFNDYTIIWDKTSITIYLDDIKIYQLYINEDKYEALHNPFYIILYLLVGGSTVDKEVNDSAFPVEMSVDYIRVYQYELNNKVGGKTNYYIETTDNASGNNNTSGNNNNNSSGNSTFNNYSDDEDENSLNIKLKSYLLFLLLSFLL
jgi:beta-glucanase (GH16 family)